MQRIQAIMAAMMLAAAVCTALAGCTTAPLAKQCETCSGAGQCEGSLVCVQSTCVSKGCKPTGNGNFSGCSACF